MGAHTCNYIGCIILTIARHNACMVRKSDALQPNHRHKIYALTGGCSSLYRLIICFIIGSSCQGLSRYTVRHSNN